MIQISQLKMPYNHSEEELIHKIMKLLHCSYDEAIHYKIEKKSIDARKKANIMVSYTIALELSKEENVVARAKNPNITIKKEKSYVFPITGTEQMKDSPIIIGSGPAGLFCAYLLSLNGYKPIVLERGKDVHQRKKDVEEFWEKGIFREESNVQFGEGGAGTFSDGKLNTLVKDKFGRNHAVLDIFVKEGAPKQILFDSKPHIGTDVLLDVTQNMRKTIIMNGGQVFFESKVTNILYDEDGVVGVEINSSKVINASTVVLAIGHSARDTFEMLYHRKIAMEAKEFAVGFRVEHPQSFINQSQYGSADMKYLPTASYKLVAQTTKDRGVYSFCMCPGGYVVNASSEKNRTVVNGMSYHARDSKNANSAIIVSVKKNDFESDHPLAGVAFQRKIEESCYALGEGKIPVQRYQDFVDNKVSSKSEFVYEPCLKGDFVLANLRKVLPNELNEAWIEGMELYNKMIPGFTNKDVIMSGIESRTSSPVRINRDETMQSNILGLYPCGEGAGYAGGIMSAAMDGVKIAEKIASIYRPILD